MCARGTRVPIRVMYICIRINGGPMYRRSLRGRREERENVLSVLAEQRCIIWSVCGQRGDGGVAGTRDKILNSDYSAEGIGTDMKYAKTNFRPSIRDLQHNRKRRWTVCRRLARSYNRDILVAVVEVVVQYHTYIAVPFFSGRLLMMNSFKINLIECEL
jgi:hypothetical protein